MKMINKWGFVNYRVIVLWGLCLCFFLLSNVSAVTLPAKTLNSSSVQGTREKLQIAYTKLPLIFEANQGQTDKRVKFLSRGNGYLMFLTASEAVLSLDLPETQIKKDNLEFSKKNHIGNKHRAIVKMKFANANPKPEVYGLNKLPGGSNYFDGNVPKLWKTNIAHYTKVAYRNIYPGIDLIFYGSQRQLEFDFVVSPGADPGAILLSFEGADKLILDDKGNLNVHIGTNKVILNTPVIYQENNGIKNFIPGSFFFENSNNISFKVASYDKNKKLFIDPVLCYSTYLGGSSPRFGLDVGEDIAVDDFGNAYITGYTWSADFPLVNPSQPDIGGDRDVFVAKLSPDGSALLYATYLGGLADDLGYGIAVNSLGQAYVTGSTQSTDFPLSNALQPTFGGFVDAFIAKISSDGSTLLYSTYFGDEGPNYGGDIDVDSVGNAYVILSSGNVIKLNSSGSGLLYSISSIGFSNPESIAVDVVGSAYIVGNTSLGDDGDAFVAKIDAAGSGLVYSKLLGGSDMDNGYGIAVDADGYAYVTGATRSADFPTFNALQTVIQGTGDAFIAKLTPDGSAFVYSTFLGGGNELFGVHEWGYDIDLDETGNAYVTGFTQSTDFPSVNAIQPNMKGIRDIFLTKIKPDGSELLFSTFFGGSSGEFGSGIVVKEEDEIYLTGGTQSHNFPTKDAFQPDFAGVSFDAFVVKFCAPIQIGIEIEIDIKPTSCPNPLNVKSRGVIPVAIIGTAGLDVTTVDIASIRLEGVPPLRSDYEDVATPLETLTGKEDCNLDCTTEGPDGFDDLTLKFRTQHIVAAIGDVEDGECMVLQLTGNLKEEFGGTPVIGEDVVVILVKGR